MTTDHDSPSARSSMDVGDSNTRKRVCKACDRCRLKKSKCDGGSPCGRCKADNAICQFGERKKAHDKVYPKGYVELLEQHFVQLTAGLRILYQKTQAQEQWPGKPLPLQRDGHPLTHDILERLSVLQSSSDLSTPSIGFEETPERMLEALTRGSRQSSARTDSLTPSSDLPPSPKHTHSRPKERFEDLRQEKRQKAYTYPPALAQLAPMQPDPALQTYSHGLVEEPLIIDDASMDDAFQADFTSFSSVNVDFSQLQNVPPMPLLDNQFGYVVAPPSRHMQPGQVQSQHMMPQAVFTSVEPPINWESWVAGA